MLIGCKLWQFKTMYAEDILTNWWKLELKSIRLARNLGSCLE